MIYADHAATTQLDPVAFEAMKPWLLEEYGNPSQLYAFSRKPKKALAEARAMIASCINAQPDEIFFTSGGTESDNWAIKGSAFGDSQKRATITSSFEHHAILHACSAIERLGWPVAYLQPTSQGFVEPELLEQVITDHTRLVSIMLANNEIGTIQPIVELCASAHAHGATFHTDAVQALGHIAIDVESLGVDMLSASAHKFNGPRGTGFLYIRRGTKLIPYMDGGAQEHNERAGTENVAAIVGMAVALQNNCTQLEEYAEHMCKLEEALIEQLRTGGVKFIRNGSGSTLPGLISLSFPGKDGEALLHRLDLLGICVSTGSACNSRNTEISHVLKALRLNDVVGKGTIRISLGKENTLEDVTTIVSALQRVLQ